MIGALWAQDLNGLIGKEQVLPWHLPNDLKYFKEQTIGKTIVMGRKTFEGMGSKPLPNRETIVLTNNKTYQATGVTVMHSVEEVLEFAKTQTQMVMIIGGGVIFNDFMPYYDCLYRTVIEETFEGDTYFPPVDWSKWEEVSNVKGTVDEKNKYHHRWEIYKRRKEASKNHQIR